MNFINFNIKCAVVSDCVLFTITSDTMSLISKKKKKKKKSVVNCF